MLQLLFFSISALFAVLTVLFVVSRILFNEDEIFFAFFPLFIVYLGFISTILSFFTALNSTNFLLLQVVLLVPASIIRLNIKQSKPHIRADSSPRNWVTLLFLITIGLYLASSLLLRIYSPLLSLDDNMYRASAPLFWIQNQSIFRFQTVDIQKNVFLLGSGLLSLWPNLFHLPQPAGNIVYWLAFPILGIAVYKLSGLISNQRNNRLLSVLLLVTSPIIFSYFTHTLIQESWLGLILISFIYFLVRDIRSHSLNPWISFCVGVSFGASIFIKTTALYYASVFVLYVTYRIATRLKYIAFGLIGCLIFSGCLLLFIQNTRLYGSPLGPPPFYQAHIAQISPGQIATHIKRIPFLFTDIPLFSQSLTDRVQKIGSNLAAYIGASAQLPGELNQANHLGAFRYELTNPNSLFGLSGILWFGLVIVTMFNLKKKNNPDHDVYLTFLIISCTWILEVLTVRWAQYSSIPDRHLLSAFCLSIGFLGLLIPKKSTNTILAILFIIIFITGLPPLFDELNTLKHVNYPYASNMIYPPYYPNFLSTLHKPSTFLLVEDEDFIDYPYFWFHLYQQNTVYESSPQTQIETQDDVQNILAEGAEKSTDYIIIPSKLVRQKTLLDQGLSQTYAFSGQYLVNDSLLFVYKKRQK